MRLNVLSVLLLLTGCASSGQQMTRQDMIAIMQTRCLDMGIKSDSPQWGSCMMQQQQMAHQAEMQSRDLDAQRRAAAFQGMQQMLRQNQINSQNLYNQQMQQNQNLYNQQMESIRANQPIRIAPQTTHTTCREFGGNLNCDTTNY